jgi:hypothetical protein
MNDLNNLFATADKVNKTKKAGFKLICWGDTGTGKTTLALDAVRFGPVMFLDFDGKAMSTATTSGADLSKIIIKDLKADTWPTAIKTLEHITATKDKLPFATIVVDTFTLLNEKVYIEVAGQRLKNINATIEQRDWGKINNQLIYFFDILFSLPVNIIINAHTAIGEDQAGRTIRVPQGRGSYKNTLNKICTDSVLLTKNLKGEHKVSTKGNPLDGFNVNCNCLKDMVDDQGMFKTFDLKPLERVAICLK